MRQPLLNMKCTDNAKQCYCLAPSVIIIEQSSQQYTSLYVSYTNNIKLFRLTRGSVQKYNEKYHLNIFQITHFLSYNYKDYEAMKYLSLIFTKQLFCMKKISLCYYLLVK